jgi:hypothetical protein
MPITPTVFWDRLIVWSAPPNTPGALIPVSYWGGGVPGVPPTNSWRVPVGGLLDAQVLSLGAARMTPTGNTNAGSGTIYALSATTGLGIAMPIVGAPIPNGSVIGSVVGSEVILAGLPALATATGAQFTVYDAQPLGYLTAAISPATGVTVVDNNPDDNGTDNYIGNGTLIANFGNEAEGGFSATFATAGTYSVSVAYVSSDPEYNNATINPLLTVTVS